MKTINIMLVALAFSLSGCGIAYRANRTSMLQAATEADYGPRPPADHQAKEKALIEYKLKDPDSAQFKFTDRISRDAIQQGFASPTPVLVWLTAAWVNAKNSFGGYVGKKAYHFAWKNNDIIAVSLPADSMEDGIYWNYVR